MHILFKCTFIKKIVYNSSSQGFLSKLYQAGAIVMSRPNQVYAFFAFVFASHAFREVDTLNYASFDSGDGNFKLQWAYNNNKLFFNMTCKTTGWCAVGFTTTADGKNMVNYDMAVAGVASNTPYVYVSPIKYVFII